MPRALPHQKHHLTVLVDVALPACLKPWLQAHGSSLRTTVSASNPRGSQVTRSPGKSNLDSSLNATHSHCIRCRVAGVPGCYIRAPTTFQALADTPSICNSIRNVRKAFDSRGCWQNVHYMARRGFTGPRVTRAAFQGPSAENTTAMQVGWTFSCSATSIRVQTSWELNSQQQFKSLGTCTTTK